MVTSLKRPRENIIKEKNNKELELRRWCIEQAIKWPNETAYGNAVGGGYVRTEVDILNKANKIYNWINNL